MNICNFVNLIQRMINYSLFGETETSMCDTEISLAEAIFMILIGFVWMIIVCWWLSPIQYIINILHLRDIKFRCNK